MTKVTSLRRTMKMKGKSGSYQYPYPWYKNNPSDKVWWKNVDSIGEFIFSFDCIHEFNFFRDYPQQLTAEQRRIFAEENPALAELKE